jgi:hypothetical protein
MKRARTSYNDEQNAGDTAGCNGQRKLLAPGQAKKCTAEHLVLTSIIAASPLTECTPRSDTDVEMDVDQNFCNTLPSISGASYSSVDEVQGVSRRQPEADHSDSSGAHCESDDVSVGNVVVSPGSTASGVQQDAIICYGMVRILPRTSFPDLCSACLRSLESNANALTRTAGWHATMAC